MERTGGTEAAIRLLRERLGRAKVNVSGTMREQHGVDESWHPGFPPDAVVLAESTEDVAAAVRVCAEHRVPVIPFGAGTSLEGHVAALHGGISLDLSGMQRVVEVNVDDLDCRVEAGIRRTQLNDRLRLDGLFFPIDPGADATLGGMASTRASGTNAVRYGTMRDNVLGLTAVMSDGRVGRFGTRARKSSAGYDLTRLLIGSEGTLGIITELVLRLYGIPEAIAGAVCSFDSLDGAVTTVIETIQLGVPVARIELLDELQVDACNRYSDLHLPVQPLLLIEFHGTAAAVEDQAKTVGSLADAHGGSGWEWSTDTETRNRLWQARHDAYYAALALRPGAKAVTTDVCVPISRLAECIAKTRAEIDAAAIQAPIVGHVGDGNFHVIFLFDPDDPAERDRVLQLHAGLVRRALDLGGTCTGEHGIGYGKLGFMKDEHDAASLAMMRSIKSALDPDNILNPGKTVPPEADS
ncbi:MAG: FAD-binding oxidoreductase [Actinomycetota bacterium]